MAAFLCPKNCFLKCGNMLLSITNLHVLRFFKNIVTPPVLFRHTGIMVEDVHSTSVLMGLVTRYISLV